MRLEVLKDFADRGKKHRRGEVYEEKQDSIAQQLMAANLVRRTDKPEGRYRPTEPAPERLNLFPEEYLEVQEQRRQQRIVTPDTKEEGGPQTPAGSLVCSECGKSDFKSRQHLNMHMSQAHRKAS